MRLSALLSAGCLSLLLTLGSEAQESAIEAEKIAAIDELITVTGAVDLGEQFSAIMVQQMAQAIRQSRPDIQPRAFEIMTEVVNELISEELASGSLQDVLYPIYDRYFTLEELQALLNYYATDIGRKTLEVMPQLTQDSIQAGQMWGAALGPRIAEQVNAALAAEGLLDD